MDILQTILDLDKAAAAQTELAVEQERRALKELEDKRLRRREKRVAEEQTRLDDLRTEQERILREKKDNADMALSEEKAKLDKVFEQHRDEWQSEIISRITGV